MPLFEIHRLYHLNILTLVDNQLTLLICCFSKVIGCSQKRRATNITSLHQTLQKGNMQYPICNMQTFQDNNFKKYDVDFQNSQPDFHFNNQHRREFKCLWFIDYIILISFEHLWIINSPRDRKRTIFCIIYCLIFGNLIFCSQISESKIHLNKGCKIGGESPRAFADELHGGCAAPARYPGEKKL